MRIELIPIKRRMNKGARVPVIENGRTWIKVYINGERRGEIRLTPPETAEFRRRLENEKDSGSREHDRKASGNENTESKEHVEIGTHLPQVQVRPESDGNPNITDRELPIVHDPDRRKDEGDPGTV